MYYDLDNDGTAGAGGDTAGGQEAAGTTEQGDTTGGQEAAGTDTAAGTD